MIRKIIHIVSWVLLLAWVTVLTGFISGKNDEILCRKLVIEISDSTDVKFITREDVLEMIDDAGFATRGYPVSTINTRRMEAILRENPYVANAEAYTNVEGEIGIIIRQRVPMLRFLPADNDGFYLDAEGVVLPLSARYSPMVLPVSGHIGLPSPEPGTSLFDPATRKKMDEEGHDYICRLFEFGEYVVSDPFWSRQFVQVYRDSRGEYELIPRVGAHQILLGSLEDYREKLRNLKLLYEQEFGKDGWNKYNRINLKYSNQVICTKR